MIGTDYRKHKRYGGNFFGIVFLAQGFWALLQYRTTSYFYRNFKVFVLRQIILGLSLLWQKAIEVTTGISLPASAKIGHSFYIGHFGQIIINAECVIGNDYNISQGGSIAKGRRSDRRGSPTVGDQVYTGANAVLAGRINVGDHAVIGANSLFNRDVPPSSTVMGVPAKVVGNKDSKDFI